jgi:peptidoglycan/xylan/chitin deacetylase (PgdA/CDA1 family)
MGSRTQILRTERGTTRSAIATAASAMSSGAFRILSPAGSRARLSILMFHRVLAEPDPLLPWVPDAARFNDVLRFVGDNFTVLPLLDAIGRMQRGDLPAASACITFDDGYADNVTVAMPLLQRHGFAATFFIASAFLDGGRMWNDDVIEAARMAPLGTLDLRGLGLGEIGGLDGCSRIAGYEAVIECLKYLGHQRRAETAREIARRAGVPDTSTLMMTTRQLRELHGAGFEVGGHTDTHPILELMADHDAEREIASGKERLESLLGSNVVSFAYPNGVPGKDFSARHGAMARRAGFSAAVSTFPAAVRRGADAFQLPRFLPWGRTPLRFAVRWAMHLGRS